MKIVGFAGCSCSGKTTFVKRLYELLKPSVHVCYMSLDSFYKTLSYDESLAQQAGNYNFDNPDAIDFGLFKSCLEQLRAGAMTTIPCYDFELNQRMTKTETLDDPDVLLIDGLFLFHYEEIRRLIDIKIFVDVDLDVALSRRIKRDVAERGRTVDSVLRQYRKFVKSGYEMYVEPTRKFADLVIPNTSDVAIEILAGYLEKEDGSED